MCKWVPFQTASSSSLLDICAWMELISSDSHRSSTFSPMVRVAITSITISSLLQIDHTRLIFDSIISMSSTPVEPFEFQQHRSSAVQSPSHCQDCQRSRLQIQSSSSEQSSSEGSQSISIHVNAHTLKSQSQKYNHLQNEMQNLQTENKLLMRKNKELMKQLIPISNSQKELKKEIKVRDRQIKQLRNQISINSYGMELSGKSNFGEVGSASKIVFEEKNYKVRSKSGRRQSKQAADLSIQREFQFNDAKFKKKQWDIQRTYLQKQILQLQQKVLFYESDSGWTLNLAYKLINLSDKLAYLFKQNVTDHKWSLRRQAKSSWRYLKHILSYFLLIQ